MKRIVLDAFPFDLPEEAFLRACRAERDSEEGERALELRVQALAVARPKAVVAQLPVVVLDDDTVRVGEVAIASRMVRVNLAPNAVAYPYVATCGTELDRWAEPLDDYVDQFYADEARKMLLGCAVRAARDAVVHEFKPAKPLSTVNPGSLESYPITEQPSLFRMLGDVAADTGVTLTDSCLMVPFKSSSGIFFEDSTGHVNCIMCPRKVCPNRRAPYQPDHYGERFGKDGGCGAN